MKPTRRRIGAWTLIQSDGGQVTASGPAGSKVTAHLAFAEDPVVVDRRAVPAEVIAAVLPTVVLETELRSRAGRSGGSKPGSAAEADDESTLTTRRGV